METLFFILGVLFIPILGVLCALLCLYKSQINSIRKQIDFIKSNDTNLKVTSKFFANDVFELINSLNSIISKHRSNEINLTKLNNSFRKTITNISHDIRTPLTSISGYVEMLNNNNLCLKTKSECIHVIENRIRYIDNMLNLLFEFSMVQSNELTFERTKININSILINTISMFSNDLSEKGLTPYINIPDTPCNIIGDENALYRIFSNIVINSLIHGENELSIISKESNNKCQIIFRINTTSICESDMNNIFERFFTSDKSRTKKSTGLYLAISQKLVHKMNGEIMSNIRNNKFSIIIEFPKSV